MKYIAYIFYLILFISNLLSQTKVLSPDSSYFRIIYNKIPDSLLIDKEMIFITEENGKSSIYLNTMPDTWKSVGNKVKELLNEEYDRLSFDM